MLLILDSILESRNNDDHYDNITAEPPVDSVSIDNISMAEQNEQETSIDNPTDVAMDEDLLKNIAVETTYNNGMYISGSDGAFANDEMSGCKFKIITKPVDYEYYYVISYNGKIGKQGMDVLNQYNESNSDATFYFTNGESYTYSVRIADHTPQDWKEFEGLADMFIVFTPVVKNSKFKDIVAQMKLFSNVDISYIAIGNNTLQFNSKGIKTSPYFYLLWKDMYEHGGWNFQTESNN